jgi:hypothetical protein
MAAKKKSETAPVNEPKPVKAESVPPPAPVEVNATLEAIDGLDLRVTCEALKRTIDASHLACRYYEEKQLRGLLAAVQLRCPA